LEPIHPGAAPPPPPPARNGDPDRLPHPARGRRPTRRRRHPALGHRDSAVVGTISAAGTDGDGVITLVLGLLVGACGIVGLRSQRGKAAKFAGAIGLVVAAVIGCHDVATICNAAG
jgi:hypothetical protein